MCWCHAELIDQADSALHKSSMQIFSRPSMNPVEVTGVHLTEAHCAVQSAGQRLTARRLIRTSRPKHSRQRPRSPRRSGCC